MPAAELVHGGGERFHVPDLRAAGRRQAHRRNNLRASAADDHEAHTGTIPGDGHAQSPFTISVMVIPRWSSTTRTSPRATSRLLT